MRALASASRTKAVMTGNGSSAGRVSRGRGASGKAAEEQSDLEEQRHRTAKPQGPVVACSWRPPGQLGPVGPRHKGRSEASKAHVGLRAREHFIYYLTGIK